MTVADGACPAQIGKASAWGIRRTRTGAQRSVLVLASSIVVAFLAAANAPSPLYERYETAWHASPLIGTIAREAGASVASTSQRRFALISQAAVWRQPGDPDCAMILA